MAAWISQFVGEDLLQTLGGGKGDDFANANLALEELYKAFEEKHGEWDTLMALVPISGRTRVPIRSRKTPKRIASYINSARLWIVKLKFSR